jgi:saccharopine dehydrogenase-like NADP-dependent oxidoreductase
MVNMYIILYNLYKNIKHIDQHVYRETLDTVLFKQMKNREFLAMRNILVIGGGNIGDMLASLLGDTDEYRVTVADSHQAPLEKFKGRKNVDTKVLDAMDDAAVAAALAGCFAVISAAPYNITSRIARAAHAAGIHYLDPTEDVASTKVVKELASTSRAALVPQCGLAPGFIAIVGKYLADKFDELDTLNLRVGALPRFPTNALTYNLTWSTDGVINEYCEPCEVIVDGKLTMVPALENVQHFLLDGESYESFNTSGGLGTLADTLAGKVRNLSYQTIRYPGHRDIMRMLITDLRLGRNRPLFKQVLENAVPATEQDVVIVFGTASGMRGGRFMQESYASKIFACKNKDRTWAAIQITTANAICAVLDMLAKGQIPQAGLVKQEDISLKDFLANRFGKVYATTMQGVNDVV